MISDDKTTTSSRAKDQANRGDERSGRQAVTTSGLLGTWRIRRIVPAHLSAIPAAATGKIPLHVLKHTPTRLDAEYHCSGARRGCGGGRGRRIITIRFCRRSFFDLVATTEDVDDAGGVVGENPGLEDGERLLESRQVVWKDGLEHVQQVASDCSIAIHDHVVRAANAAFAAEHQFDDCFDNIGDGKRADLNGLRRRSQRKLAAWSSR